MERSTVQSCLAAPFFRCRSWGGRASPSAARHDKIERMKALAEPAPLVVPVDDEHVRMMSYALSSGGRDKIAKAQAEIDQGKGILADKAYFEALAERRAKARPLR